MDVTATIDYSRGENDYENDYELSLSNFDDAVKIEAPALFKGPIYIDRQQLLQALAALDVGAS